MTRREVNWKESLKWWDFCPRPVSEVGAIYDVCTMWEKFIFVEWRFSRDALFSFQCPFVQETKIHGVHK